MSEYELIKQWMTWKSFRENKPYSYEDLASDVGLDLESLIKLFTGLTDIDKKTIQKIARVFGVKLSEFYSGPPDDISMDGKDISIPLSSKSAEVPRSSEFTSSTSPHAAQDYGLKLSQKTPEELDELFHLLGFESKELFEQPVDTSQFPADKTDVHEPEPDQLIPEKEELQDVSVETPMHLNKRRAAKKKKTKCKIIAVAHHRGGTGKTTCTVNIGFGLTRLKKKVLLIDVDSKTNLTESFGIHDDEYKNTLSDLISGSAHLSDVIIEKYGLSLIPSRRLHGVPDSVRTIFPDRKIFRKVLEDVSGFDYILIDCPPSLGDVMASALMASDEVIIPILPEYISVSGIDALVDTIHSLNGEAGGQIEISMIVSSRYRKDIQHHQDMMERIHKRFGETAMYAVIRDDPAISEALREGKPVIEYDSKSPASEDFFNLCQRIVNME